MMDTADYRVISSLMQQLPNDGKWTRSRRDRWVEAMAKAIDFLTEIVEEPPTTGKGTG